MDEKAGICYFSTIPTGMTVSIFSEHMQKFGDVIKVYLIPKNSNKKSKQREYVEGWVQFAAENQAVRASNSLNSHPIAANKRKKWFGELWNVRFLPDTQWTDLFSYEHEKNILHKSAHDRDIIQAKKKAKEFMEDIRIDKMIKSKELKGKRRYKERDSAFLHKKQKLTQDEILLRKSRSHRTVSDNVFGKCALKDCNFMNNLFCGGL